MRSLLGVILGAIGGYMAFHNIVTTIGQAVAAINAAAAVIPMP